MLPFRSFGLAAAALSLTCATYAQRLPQTARPEHYTLALTPDLAAATFSGTESIDVQLSAPSRTITLNAAEIKFKSVTAMSGGNSVPAKVSEDATREQVTFTFAKELPAGAVVLHIEYSGILNDQLRGFYLSKTSKRNYAVTQFEPTDARRAFPSFDEPAYKATYDVSLTIDKADTAISNTNIVSDTPGPMAGKHTLHFATTPKMSSYLVAFLVGDFVCSSGSSDGVPIRACATPDKLALTPYAVKAAEFVLHYYDTYFGIKYPMPKLDMVAIPDFEAGAMENFGAITYRETDFLVDEQHGSQAAKQRVAQVVAHEMAHQWFGDMVTMQWWNNLWLNEGFASWMENKPVAAWHPEWHIPEQVASELNATLNLDARAVTRTIRAEADTPDQINEMFDGITYQKGGAVLDMVESYLGEETFRKGVHNYLQAHLFGNATAEDFWNTQAQTSQKPVDKIMESFVAQPGVPLITLTDAAGGQVKAEQSRFFVNAQAVGASAQHTAQTWAIPVCVKSVTAGCQLLRSSNGELNTGTSDFLFANAHGVGYYRTAYSADAYAKLLPHVETSLTPEERISLIGDEWAQVSVGKQPVGASLDLAAATRSDASVQVVGTSLSEIGTIREEIAATQSEKDAVNAWLRATYKPEFDKLGMPSASDTPEHRELRNRLFRTLGYAGDPGIIAIASHLADMFVTNPDSVEPGLADAALGIAAENGDAALFDRFQKQYETSNDPVRQNEALHLLANFKQPALIDRALDYAASGKVRNQDSVMVFSHALANPETREEAWRYIQANWPKVQAQITTMMGGYLVGATGNFCSAEKSQEVESFFTTHKVPAAERALARAKSQINDCVELRSGQEGNLQTWLAGHK